VIVPRSKKFAKRGESVANYCFCADTATAVRRYRVLIAPNKHSPCSVSRSTPRSHKLELRPLHLYCDRVAYKRRFYYAQATLTAPQLRAHHALGAT